MNPQTPNSGPNGIAGLGLVVGAFTAMWAADKAADKAMKAYRKHQTKRVARAWLRTWKEIDDRRDLKQRAHHGL